MREAELDGDAARDITRNEKNVRQIARDMKRTELSHKSRTAVRKS
jgi:hypothetical protein